MSFCKVKHGNIALLHKSKVLMKRLSVEFSTCETYQLKSPIVAGRSLKLNKVKGLAVGDSIYICSNFYGRSNVKSHTLNRKIMNIRNNILDVDSEFPAHFIKYSNGVIVIKRDVCSKKTKASLVSEKFTKDVLVQKFNLENHHFKMVLKVNSSSKHQTVKFETTTTFKKQTKLFNLSFLLDSKKPLKQAFLKNRKVQDIDENLEDDIWLFDGGSQAGEGNGAWSTLHNPGMESAEIVGAKHGHPIRTIEKSNKILLVFNLVHFNHNRYRVHKKMIDEQRFSEFIEYSAPIFKKTETITNSFSIHVGENVNNPPRPSLVPDGFLAASCWSEHADSTCIESHRAIYFGSEKIKNIDKSTGGFCFHKHAVTKSVFFDNPNSYSMIENKNGVKRKIETITLKRSKPFKRFLVDLRSQGYEICLHSLCPDDILYPKHFISEFYREFNSKTLIDHALQYNRQALGFEGMSKSKDSSVLSELEKNNINYLWVWSSTDFMPTNKSEINLLNNSRSSAMPTPLFWRSKYLPVSSVIWASHEADIAGFTKPNIEQLINDRGISIHQHYYPFVIGKNDFGFLDVDKEGYYRISEKFDRILEFMSEKRNEGKLLICNVGELLDYWLKLESIEIYLKKNGFLFQYTGEKEFKGFSFFCEKNVNILNNTELRSVSCDKDHLFSFDLKPGIKYEFSYV